LDPVCRRPRAGGCSRSPVAGVLPQPPRSLGCEPSAAIGPAYPDCRPSTPQRPRTWALRVLPARSDGAVRCLITISATLQTGVEAASRAWGEERQAAQAPSCLTAAAGCDMFALSLHSDHAGEPVVTNPVRPASVSAVQGRGSGLPTVAAQTMAGRNHAPMSSCSGIWRWDTSRGRPARHSPHRALTPNRPSTPDGLNSRARQRGAQAICPAAGSAPAAQ
jgi:hypothetical protein